MSSNTFSYLRKHTITINMDGTRVYMLIKMKLYRMGWLSIKEIYRKCDQRGLGIEYVGCLQFHGDAQGGCLHREI